MKYLLDTCVVSEMIKKSPDNNVIKWLNSIDDQNIYLSVITFGEIQKGISKLKNSKKKDKLRNWFDNILSKKFENRIVNISNIISKTWGHILGLSELAGKKLPVIDTLIASSALVNNYTLVTRNTKDFQLSGCKLLNPWIKK